MVNTVIQLEELEQLIGAKMGESAREDEACTVNLSDGRKVDVGMDSRVYIDEQPTEIYIEGAEHIEFD
jgi:hypothetical protein